MASAESVCISFQARRANRSAVLERKAARGEGHIGALSNPTLAATRNSAHAFVSPHLGKAVCVRQSKEVLLDSVVAVTHMLRRYCPPTSNKAFVICPREHTRTASINTSNTFLLSMTAC